MAEFGRFHWLDHLAFGLVMAVSMLVGVFFGIRDRRRMSTEQFLMAGRKMSVLPVSISLFVSWTSTISFLGDPVECYTYGAVYGLLLIGYLLALPLVANCYAPYFQKMKITSAFEYLRTHYSPRVQLLGTLIGFVATAIWIACTIYSAGLALTQVSGFQLHWSLILIGVICTFYTSLGGMKAVLWADTLQMVIMVVGQIIMISLGIQRVGGVQQVWQIANDGGRLNFNMDNMTLSLMSRTSMMAFIVGGFFRILTPFTSNQLFIQRYGTVETPRQAKMIVYFTMPMYVGLVFVMTSSGLIMYALYHACDPLSGGIITRRDQMVPLMMIDLLGHFPGLPGLFMATLFSAALSSMSSGINAMSAQMLKDMAQPLYSRMARKQMPEKLSSFLAKTFAVISGVLVTGLAFVPSAIGEALFGMTARLSGLFGGPVSGIFFVAILLPNIGTAAVVTGFLVTVAVLLWLVVGSFLVPQYDDLYMLPMLTHGCTLNVTNVSSLIEPTRGLYNLTTTDVLDETRQSGFTDVYRIAHIHFFAIGIVGTVLIAVFIHLLQVLWKKYRHSVDLDSIGKMSVNGKGSLMEDDLKKIPLMNHEDKLKGDKGRLADA